MFLNCKWELLNLPAYYFLSSGLQNPVLALYQVGNKCAVKMLITFLEKRNPKFCRSLGLLGETVDQCVCAVLYADF